MRTAGVGFGGESAQVLTRRVGWQWLPSPVGSKRQAVQGLHSAATETELSGGQDEHRSCTGQCPRVVQAPVRHAVGLI
jgi:hypothetical protein